MCAAAGLETCRQPLDGKYQREEQHHRLELNSLDGLGATQHALDVHEVTLTIAAQVLVGGGATLLLLMFVKGGLAQLLYAIRDGWLRWVAARRGIDVPSLIADRAAST